MRIFLFAAVLCLPLACLAVPTGLNLMPTADVLGAAQSRLDYESSGGGKLYMPSGETLVGAQGGASLGFEAGIDHAGGLGTLYNAKWQLMSDGTLLPAVAVGIQGVHSGVKAQDYIVATKALFPTSIVAITGLHIDVRGSAGLMRQDGHTAVMYGAKATLGRFNLAADHINGSVRDGNAVSAGWTFGNTLTVTGTRYFYKSQSAVNTLTVSYSFGPKL